MKKYKRKKRKKGFRLKHFILLLIVLWLGKTVINQGMTIRELENRRLAEEEEINLLETDIEVLEKEIENTNSLEFIEKVARDELRLVKPREIIYIDKNKQDNLFTDPDK